MSPDHHGDVVKWACQRTITRQRETVCVLGLAGGLHGDVVGVLVYELGLC